MHILGAGSIGCLAASRIPGATLILRNAQKLYQYQQVDQTITITGDQHTHTHVPGICPQTIENPISHLIVATKAQDTVAALEPLKPYLAQKPTIVLLQNGIGTEKTVSDLLGDVNLAFAITSQGVKRTTPASFTFELSGAGEFYYSSNSCDLKIPGFEYVEWSKFQHQRLTKLLVNAAINPLTGVLRCKNGALSTNKSRFLMAPIVRESCNIVNTAFNETFDQDAVLDQVVKVAEHTANNTSSMLSDILNGYTTEIEFINGQLVKLGKEHGASTSYNAMLQQLVELQKVQEIPMVWDDLDKFVK